MKRVSVDSRGLREVGHENGVLEVQFHAKECPKTKDKALACMCLGGNVATVEGVTPEEHAALLAAESPGGHFIKHFHARNRKISQEE